MVNKFTSKGCDKAVTEMKRYEVGKANRNQLLQNRQIQDSGELPMAPIMDYNLQYKQVENIIRKYRDKYQAS